MPFRLPSFRSEARRAAIVGLDLSPTRFKLVALAEGADAPELLGYVDAPADEGSADRAFDSRQVAARVRKELHQMGVEPAAVALALGPTEAVVRRLAVVPQAREATVAALSLQLAPALGPDVAAPRVDYAPLDGAGTGGRVAVLAAAGRPDAIAAQCHAVAEAGFEVAAVVPAAAALMSAWRTLGPAHAGSRVLLVHVGESAVLWIAIENDEPAALDAPLVGVASLRERAGGRRNTSGALGEPAPAAVAEWVARIRQEVHRGMHAAKRDTAQADAATDLEVWLCGGGARISGLEEALSASLGTAVHLFDPVAAMAGEPVGDGFGPALVPALGAAVQALSPDSARQALDLRPPAPASTAATRIVPFGTLVRAVVRDRAWRFTAAAAVGGCLLTLAAGARQSARVEALSRREAQLVIDSARVANAMAQNQALVSRRGELGAAVEQLQRLERARRLWVGVLDGVVGALPGSAWISTVAEEREDPASGDVAVRIRGFAPSEVVASSYQARLADAGFAATGGAQTRLVSIGSVAAVEFELVAEADVAAAEAKP